MTRRRQFEVPEEDRDFLENRLGLEWEAVREGDVRRVVVLKYAVPDGYNVTEADLFLRLDAGYPDSQIDMVFFNPVLGLKSGRRIGATDGRQEFDGRSWQQWSRHRTPQNPWVPGVDNIERHMLLVREWLDREPRT
ncbi:MAG: E2/UBC family protein [Kofleriaceae bacterium]